MPVEVETPEGATAAFRVGEWLVEPLSNRISNDEISVRLELKVMDVLVCLAERAGEVLTRQELIDRVWATEFIADNTLTHAIAEIRTALGDDAREPHYIETIPRRGYRLVAKVTLAELVPGIEVTKPERPRSMLRPAAWAATVGLLGFVLGYALIAWQQPSSATSVTDFDPHRIAVVPFENRTGIPSLHSLVALTGDRLTQGFAELEEIEVVPASVVRAASTGVDSPHLARTVAAATSAGLILTGVLDAVGDDLELQATLEDATTGSVVRAFEPIATSRDAPQEAITTLRERTLMAVQDHLHPVLAFAAGDRWPDYRAYLAYRAWIENMGRVGGPSALELDPEFVRARLGIAMGLALNGKLPQAEALLKSLESRTLNSAQTHLFRGLEHHSANRWGHALNEFDWLRVHGGDNFFVRFAQLFYGKRCNRLQQTVEAFESLGSPPFGIPLEGWARSIAVDAYHLLGRYDDELELARRWKGDSHGWLHVPSYVEARALIGLGRLDELQLLIADAQTRKDAGNFVFQIAYVLDGHGYRSESIEMAEWSHQWYVDTGLFEQGSVACERCIADSLRWVGRYAEALEVYLEVEHQEPDNPRWWAGIGICAANVGDRDNAEAMIARFEELREKTGSSEYTMPRQYSWAMPGVAAWGQAGIESALGNRDDALRLLREAIAQGWYEYMWIHSWDSFRDLRDDPEFQELVRPKG
jgi:DNA-binding winged helix-turn-helix (wHTH) protein/tetratricopeptide (TPR) repeat protein/TolB-like protein